MIESLSLGVFEGKTPRGGCDQVEMGYLPADLQADLLDNRHLSDQLVIQTR
jgi:hypothetical protein